MTHQNTPSPRHAARRTAPPHGGRSSYSPSNTSPLLGARSVGGFRPRPSALRIAEWVALAVVGAVAVVVVHRNVSQDLFHVYAGGAAQDVGMLPDRQNFFGIPMDFQVYYGAGAALNAGQDLYSHPFFVTNSGMEYWLPYTYPPFASLIFGIVARLPLAAAAAFWQVGMLVCLAIILGALLRRAGYRMTLGGAIALIALLLAALVIAPVRSSLFWGQINIYIMALVCLDFMRGGPWPAIRRDGWRDDHWLAGVGVGLAAGIKLYPAFFGIVFLLQRRWRAAAVSALTFFATVALGAIGTSTSGARSAPASPAPGGGSYWFDTMLDTSRFGGLANPTSQSWKLWLVRLTGGEGGAVTLGWVALSLLTVALCVLGCRWALARELPAVAMSIAGMAACLVSPFSWHHYYLWVVPLGFALGIWVMRGIAGAGFPRGRGTESDVGVMPAPDAGGAAGGQPTSVLPGAGGVARGVLAGAAAPLVVLAAWAPYISVVFFAPFDIYGQMASPSVFAQGAWVWWSLLWVAVPGVLGARDLASRDATRPGDAIRPGPCPGRGTPSRPPATPAGRGRSGRR